LPSLRVRLEMQQDCCAGGGGSLVASQQLDLPHPVHTDNNRKLLTLDLKEKGRVQILLAVPTP